MKNRAVFSKGFAHAVMVGALISILSMAAHAQASRSYTFNTLFNFNGDNGTAPSTLVQGLDGNFYGTTLVGGTNASGSFFKISPDGAFQTLYSFCSLANCADGTIVLGQISRGQDGNFYGTTFQGGSNPNCEYQGGCGTVFKITPAGLLTTLYSFSGGSDGGFSYGGVVQGKDGNFYGTTAYAEPSNGGTVFKITPAGQLTTLYGFCLQSGCPDGAVPQANLVQDANGNFFGTTNAGSGPNNGGTVFKITPSGSLTTLHRFCLQQNCSDGAAPFGSLFRASNGAFYGTTYAGGSQSSGTIYAVNSSGAFRIVHNFDFAHGANPYAALIKGPDGALYGTTAFGGTNDAGTIFRVTLAGGFTLLHSFSANEGSQPQTALILGADGSFYGTASSGGLGNDGTVFRLTPN